MLSPFIGVCFTNSLLVTISSNAFKKQCTKVTHFASI